MKIIKENRIPTFEKCRDLTYVDYSTELSNLFCVDGGENC